MAIVTISGGSGSGGRLLAERLAQDLGYHLVTRKDVVHVAATYGVSEMVLQDALLKPPSFWDRFKHERRRYLAFVQAALCERAVEDNVVYHGNAGQLLLHGPSHLVCLRLIVPMSVRVATIVEREGVDAEVAERQIEESDVKRQNWTRFLYGVDWLDPSLYDLTLNLRTLDLDGAEHVAAETVRRPEFAATAESRRVMTNLLLSSRVGAALAADERTAAAEVEVRADDGVVYLKGKLRQSPVVESVIEITSRVEGVGRVDREQLDAPSVIV